MGRIWRALKLGMKSLLLHKLRSGLTVLGIVFGVAAVISMLAIAEGTSREARDQIRALGATNIIIRSVKPSEETQATGGRPSRILNYGLKYSDFDRIVNTIPTIRKVLPVREIRKQIRRGSYFFDGRVVGTTEDYADFNLLQMAKGRFLTATDNEKYENFAVLASDTAKQLFPYEDPIDQSIKLGKDYYKVIGVTENRAKRESSADLGGSVAAQDFNRDVYIPLNNCRLRFGERIIDNRSGSMQAEETQLTQITVQVGSMDEVLPTVPLIEASYEPYHPRKDVEKTVPYNLLVAAEKQARQFSIILGTIASISLLVGGIGIMNIMLATVTEPHARDRNPPGPGGQTTRYHPAIPDRDRRTLGRRRPAGSRRRIYDPTDHYIFHTRSEGVRDRGVGHAGFLDLGGHRHLVRHLPRSASRPHGPD